MNGITHQKAMDLALKTKWKTTPCTLENCWCLMIEPIETISYGPDEIEEFYIVGGGEIHAKVAEYIVLLHNNNLNKTNYE